MRRLLSATTVLAATLGLVAVPVVARPVPQAHAVAPHVQNLHVPARAAHHGTLGAAALVRTHRFNLVGATWEAGTLDAGATRIQVRVHTPRGWSRWRALSPNDGGADAGTVDARRAARINAGMRVAEPLYVGSADGVRARVIGDGQAPADLQVVLVDGGSSAADAHPRPARVWGGAVANADEPQPAIYTRADWGADESLRKNACPNGPTYMPTIKMGFVHHTDTGNGYSRSAVPSIIRSIYAYHVRANGWCDVGYNYLVDRFGRIWEGRFGGITKPVLGAHTGGFNYNSFGVSLIGTYTSVDPSADMLDAVERLFAWRLGMYYRDPLGRATVTAGSFSGSRFRTGSEVTFRTISGHRDADTTTCPGSSAYGELPDIRSDARQTLGAGFVAPKLDPSTTRMSQGPVRVTAGVVTKQSWTLTVTDVTGTTVHVDSGTASRSVDVDATWDLTGLDGMPVLPGDYTMTLTGTADDGSVALPWSGIVDVDPPVTLSAPAQTGLHDPVTVKGRGIPGHSVAVTVTGPAGSQQLGVVPVSAGGRWSAAATPVPADGDLTWTVADQSVPNYQRSRTTRVGPEVISPDDPAFVTAGNPLTVTGTALPGTGATIRLMTRAVSATRPSTGPAISVGADGSWTATFTPTQQTSYWAVDGRGLATSARTVYPVGPVNASAPSAGYASRSVVVRGDAGDAPVPLRLSAKQPGNGWSVVREVVADPDGSFRVRLPLANAAGQSTQWKVTNGYAAADSGAVTIRPLFAPTATGPARSAWHGVHALSGIAVPGDTVTVWTAPPGTPGGSTRWVARGTATASSDKSWSLSLRFTKDTSWRVTSPSGASAIGTTIVVPTIYAPARAVARSAVDVHGRAIPGRQLTLYRRVAGSTDWSVVKTLTVPADGRWSVRLHPRRSLDLRAVSGGHGSRTITVAVE